MGGAIRDLLLLNLALPASLTYGVVFGLEAVGLLAAALILAQVNVLSFAEDVGRFVSRAEAQIASAD